MYKINENSSSRPMVEGCHACDDAEYLYFHDDGWHVDEVTNINYCPQCGVLLQIPIVTMERNPVWKVEVPTWTTATLYTKGGPPLRKPQP